MHTGVGRDDDPGDQEDQNGRGEESDEDERCGSYCLIVLGEANGWVCETKGVLIRPLSIETIANQGNAAGLS